VTAPRTTWFLLHAAGAGPGSLKPLAQRLLASGCRVERPTITHPYPGICPINAAADALVDAARSLGTSARIFGHSMGGLVAIAAVLRGARPRELVLYEPIVHAALDPTDPEDANALRPDTEMLERLTDAVRTGDLARGAEAFVDSMGAGTWATLPAPAQEQLARQAPALAELARAVARYRVDVGALARTAVEVRLLRGSRSPSFTRTIARRLAQALPSAALIDVEYAHHMAPAIQATLIAPLLEMSMEATRPPTGRPA